MRGAGKNLHFRSITYILLTIIWQANIPVLHGAFAVVHKVTDSPRTTYIRDYNACGFYKSVCTQRNDEVVGTVRLLTAAATGTRRVRSSAVMQPRGV